MKTVTICGSMKFETEMQRIAFLLETKHNMNVLQCVYNVDNLDITPMEQVSLENAHYRKIELSDAIYVVDIQGYIGNQVSKEIAFAKSKGKKVIFHSPLADILHVSKQGAVLATQFGDGWSNTIYPTNASYMATMAVAKVNWVDWLKFQFPLHCIWTVVSVIMLIIAQTINIGPF